MNKIAILLLLILDFVVAQKVMYQSIEGCSKPSSYISMNYKIEDNNSIGSNIDIEVALMSDNDTKIVSVDIKEDSELNIISIDRDYRELDNRDSYDINITTKSLVDGEFYVTLYTKTSYNGNFRYKSFIIPVQIGTPKIQDSKSDNNFVIYKGMERIGIMD